MCRVPAERTRDPYNRAPAAAERDVRVSLRCLRSPRTRARATTTFAPPLLVRRDARRWRLFPVQRIRAKAHLVRRSEFFRDEVDREFRRQLLAVPVVQFEILQIRSCR